MLGVFGSLRAFIKVRDISNDCPVFRLHYQFTTLLLLIFILMVSATQFIGKPIDCIVDGNTVPANIMNSYCWITSTFTMPNGFERQSINAFPGVATYSHESDQPRKFYSYYQWVVFVLGLMAILCYVPKFVWESMENNLMTTVVMGLNCGLKPDEEVSQKRHTLVSYMLRHIRSHDMYVYRYFFCELLCLINIVGQMYLMDSFFDGEFMSYGSRVISFSEMSQEIRYDPMIYVFPRLTKCSFRKFGPSGTIAITDGLCVLAQNIVNEKAFIFVWFWYVIMATLLCGVMVFRLVLVFLPAVRPYLIHMRNRMISVNALQVICDKSSVGDWWILYMLCFNLDPFIFKDVITELSKKIETEQSNASPTRTSVV